MNALSPTLREGITPERLALLGCAIVLAALLASGPHFGVANPSRPSNSNGPSLTPTLAGGIVSQLAAQSVAAHEQIGELAGSLTTEVAAKRIDAQAVEALLSQVGLAAQSAAATADRLAASPAARPIAIRLSAAYNAIETSVHIALTRPAGDEATLASDARAVVDACAALPPLTSELRVLRRQLQPSVPAQG